MRAVEVRTASGKGRLRDFLREWVELSFRWSVVPGSLCITLRAWRALRETVISRKARQVRIRMVAVRGGTETRRSGI